MKSTPLSQGVTMLILGIYLLYGFFALPFAGFMMSLAIGLIAYGASESFELATAAILTSGVLYSLISKSSFKYKEGFSTDGATQISDRVRRIYKANVEPKGVYASAFVEGFADAKADTTQASGTTDQPPKPATKDATATAAAESQPASSASNGNAGSGTPVAQPPVAAGFTGSSDTSGQFQLGVLPKDTKGGFHIDQGTTVMNALNALKPDQIKAMTNDTQALIETQKSLMGMLSSMKPMLQDGKQMMDMFQQMFGSGAATGAGASGGQFGQLKL